MAKTQCPECGELALQIKDSRPANAPYFDALTIRRRRLCEACGARFVTYEITAEEIDGIKRTVAKRLVKDLLDVAL